MMFMTANGGIDLVADNGRVLFHHHSTLGDFFFTHMRMNFLARRLGMPVHHPENCSPEDGVSTLWIDPFSRVTG